MAKLTRVTQPIFASAAAVNETSVFGTMKTSAQYTANIADSINTVAFTKGWTDAVELDYAPFVEDMNTVQRAITYQIAYNQQEGIPEWASDTTYYKGGWAKYNAANGAQIYESLVDNNVGNLVSDNTKWKLVLDTENGYVTTNTAQTITGIKTFTAKLSTAPIELYPISGSDKPYIDFHYDSSSSDYTSRIIENSSGNLTISATSLQAPTPSDTTSTSSQKVATTGWVNTSGNNVVHLDSDEIISGKKSFTNANGTTFTTDIIRINGLIQAGTAPSSDTNTVIRFEDKNGKALGHVYHNYTTTKTSRTLLQASKANSSSDTGTANISIVYPASGNPYGTAPHSDTNGSILTTVNKSKAQNGYFKLGNGLIIQWGYETITSGQHTKTVTLPTAFTSTNYSVALSRYKHEWTEGVMMQSDNYTTTTFDFTSNDPAVHWIAIGY